MELGVEFYVAGDEPKQKNSDPAASQNFQPISHSTSSTMRRSS
jgi:hypothetical protein